MGKNRDRRKRKRRTNEEIEEDRRQERQHNEADRAAARRFFGGGQQCNVPVEEEAPPIPPPILPQAQQDDLLLPVAGDSQEPEVGNASLEPEVGEADPSDQAEDQDVEGEFVPGVDSVDLSSVPKFFRKYVRDVMLEFKRWWKITGNQHKSTVRGTWKWKSMEAPCPDPSAVEGAGPLEYLIPKFCRVQFYMPELFYVCHFEKGQMPCKFHGWGTTCCTRSKFFNPAGPRLVVDADGTLRFIFCSVYYCSEEKASFRGFDPQLLAQYIPAHIRKSLSCVLSQQAGISVAVLQDIERSLLTSQASFASQSTKLKETLKDAFYSTEHEYWSSMQHQAKRRKLMHGQSTLAQVWRGFDPSKPTKFPDIEEVIGDRAFISGRVLRELYCQRSEDQQGYFQLHMQLTDTLYLKGDKSFKVTKMIFTKGGGTSKAFDAVYTVMNHNGQIVAQYFTITNGPQELKNIHAAIKKRMLLHGYPNVKLMWVDDCCHEHDAIVHGFPELRDGREVTQNSETQQQSISTLERFSVRGAIGDVDPWHIVSANDLSRYAMELSRQQNRNRNNNHLSYLSIDCEWNEEDESPEKPHTLQVAINDGAALSRNLVALIQLDRVTEGGTVDIPNALKVALADSNSRLVGVSVQLDITNLNHHFDGLICDAENRKLDLGVWARRIGLVQRGGSLQFLTGRLLSKFLDKESETRCSTWSLFNLSQDQKEYALCDAIAGLQVALELERLDKVHRTPNPEVEGEFVCGRIYRLFNKTGTAIVAIGKITAILPQRKCQVRLLRVLKPGTRPWLGNSNKDTLGGYGVGNHVEWALKRLKFASQDEEEIVLDEAISAATRGTSADGLVDDGVVDGQDAPDEVVELPEGIDLDLYPDSHEGGGPATMTPTTAQQPAAQSQSQRVQRRSRRSRRNWKRTRIKLDIFHAKKRLKDTVKKLHGCYQHFCQMVSDAFFITNPDDWEKQRQKVLSRLRESGDIDEARLAESVRVELKRKRAKYEQHCRRSVPAPDVLEARLKSVVELFGNVEDCKTGEKFFSKKTWKAYTALIKHVRKGCLSDDPDTNHYYLARGKLFCIRGTNALEGYHRALRRIIQQYHATPRLCIHVLSAFNYRWNIDRMTDRELIPSKYENFYKQYLIEEIQEMTYDFFDDPIHAEWNSSKGVASSGEIFYWPMDESMNAAKDDDVEEGPISHVPFQKITTKYERNLFDTNVARFNTCNQVGASSENPTAMYDKRDWSGFQQWWEKKVEWNESLPLEDRNAIFRKTSSMLKEYYTASLKRANRDATLNQASPSGGTIADHARTLTASLRNSTDQGVYHPIGQPMTVARPAIDDNAGVPVGVPPVELTGASAANRRKIVAITARYEHMGRLISPIEKHGVPPEENRKVALCKRCGLKKKGEGHEGGVRKNSLQYCSVIANWFPNERIPEAYRCVE